MSPEEYVFQLNTKELKELDPEITLRRVGNKYAVEKNGKSFTVFALLMKSLLDSSTALKSVQR